jgi:hypothetical protein
MMCIGEGISGTSVHTIDPALDLDEHLDQSLPAVENSVKL